MKPVLISYWSPNIEDLASYIPEDSEVISFMLDMIIGAEGEDFEEYFWLKVHSVKFLMGCKPESFPLTGRHQLLIKDYNWPEILSYIENYLSECEDDTWEQVANKIGRFAKWEFEDNAVYEKWKQEYKEKEKE